MVLTKTIKDKKEYKIDSAKIRIQRAEKNWTKSKLAEEAQITRKTLGLIENGTSRKINIKTLEKVAKALGKTVEDFIEN